MSARSRIGSSMRAGLLHYLRDDSLQRRARSFGEESLEHLFAERAAANCLCLLVRSLVKRFDWAFQALPQRGSSPEKPRGRSRVVLPGQQPGQTLQRSLQDELMAVPEGAREHLLIESLGTAQ